MNLSDVYNTKFCSSNRIIRLKKEIRSNYFCDDNGARTMWTVDGTRYEFKSEPTFNVTTGFRDFYTNSTWEISGLSNRPIAFHVRFSDELTTKEDVWEICYEYLILNQSLYRRWWRI